MTMKNEFILLGRAIVTAGVWIAACVSSEGYIFGVAVVITIITGVSSET